MFMSESVCSIVKGVGPTVRRIMVYLSLVVSVLIRRARKPPDITYSVTFVVCM